MADTEPTETREPGTSRLDRAREKLYDAAHELGRRADARRRYDTASEKLGEGYKRLSDDWSRKSTDWAETVRTHPGRALLAAAGLGFVVGLIFRSRSH